jgi:hypothetical protein
MTNFIQGHDLGRRFKALVTHDGMTNTAGSYSTEELWFTQHDVSLGIAHESEEADSDIVQRHSLDQQSQL